MPQPLNRQQIRKQYAPDPLGQGRWESILEWTEYAPTRHTCQSYPKWGDEQLHPGQAQQPSDLEWSWRRETVDSANGPFPVCSQGHSVGILTIMSVLFIIHAADTMS
jgi:hypothetical protein